jgi:hypothetical protein
MEKALPNAAKFAVESVCPRRTIERTLMLLPTLALLNVLMCVDSLASPTTLKPLPKRDVALNERQLLIVKNLSIEQALPRRTWDLILMDEAQVAKLSTLMDELKREKLRTLMADPKDTASSTLQPCAIFTMLPTDSELPKRR